LLLGGYCRIELFAQSLVEPRERLSIGFFIELAIRCAAALFSALDFARAQDPGVGCLLSRAALAFAAVFTGAPIFAIF